MIIKSNDCCDCSNATYPCIGSSCKLLSVTHYICDKCDEEVCEGELYWFHDEQLCIECISDELEVVTDE